MQERQTQKKDSGKDCTFRIATEGLGVLLPHMTKQVIPCSLRALAQLLLRRSVPCEEFANAEPGARAGAGAGENGAGGDSGPGGESGDNKDGESKAGKEGFEPGGPGGGDAANGKDGKEGVSTGEAPGGKEGHRGVGATAASAAETKKVGVRSAVEEAKLGCVVLALRPESLPSHKSRDSNQEPCEREVGSQGESVKREGRSEDGTGQFWRHGPCIAVLAWKGKKNISIMLPDCDIQQLLQRLPGMPDIINSLPKVEPKAGPGDNAAEGAKESSVAEGLTGKDEKEK